MKILAILCCLFLLNSCKDDDVLTKANKDLKNKLLLAKVKIGTLESQNKNLTKQKLQLEDKINNMNQDFDSMRETIQQKQQQVEEIQATDPTRFWISKLAPNVEDCLKFMEGAQIYIHQFSKNAPHYESVQTILHRCKRETTIKKLVSALKFKKAMKVAITPKEKKLVTFAKQEYAQYGSIMKKVNNGDAASIYEYLKQNVISAYSLEKRYNTPLKVKKFKRTEDYREKFEKLTALKDIIMGKDYSVTIHSAFKKPFDVAHSAFLVQIGRSFGFDMKKAAPPYSYQNFNFPNLEYISKQGPFGENRPNMQFLKIPVPEEVAAKIEKSPKNYACIIHFKVAGTKEMPYKFYDNNKNDHGGLHTILAKLVLTDQVKMYIKDTKKNKLIYNVTEEIIIP